MQSVRPYVISVAGFDPSGGAGLLADIKTMEQCSVYGLAVQTALTYQNDVEFRELDWVSWDKIRLQLDVLLDRFLPSVVKVGIVEDLNVLLKIVRYVNEKMPTLQIVWDPVIRATAGFQFQDTIKGDEFDLIMQSVSLITPNKEEYVILFGDQTEEQLQLQLKVNNWASVLLKGGHGTSEKSTDILIESSKIDTFEENRVETLEKHGTGCVLSSAIASYLAQGLEMSEACMLGKQYVTRAIKSNNTRLSYHH